jgi:tetratricopeptide (TPR) repeat protein
MIKIATLFCIPVLLLALIASSTTSTDPQEAARRLNNIGVAYMNQQLFEKGLKAFEEAAAKDPNLKVTTLNRGVALLNLQRIDEAKALLQKATHDDPKDAHPWYNLGLYYKNSSVPEQAVEAFRRVTEIDPNDADSWYFLGSTYAQLKQYPEAIDAFEHALKIDPLHASAQFGLSRSYQQSGQADKAREGLKKFQYITQNKLGTPISLAYGEQGKYSRAEESPVAVEKVGAAIPVRFVDVTSRAGLPTEVSLKESRFGACFLDYDNDGKVDLFLAGDEFGGPALFHNLGNGRFEDVSKKVGLDPNLRVTGCTVGDYDNDGSPDLALSTTGGILLLHNDQGHKFADVTHAAGIKSGRVAGSSVVVSKGLNFVDYDHDGDVDLQVTDEWVIVNQSLQTLPQPARMWRNNGNGTFTDVTEGLGLLEANAINAVGTDYNNDRAVDIAITGSEKAPAIFENPREGKFPASAALVTAAMPEFPVGLAALDFNHDRWMDIAFTHDSAPGISLWENKLGKHLISATSCSRLGPRLRPRRHRLRQRRLGRPRRCRWRRKTTKASPPLRNLGPDGWKRRLLRRRPRQDSAQGSSRGHRR